MFDTHPTNVTRWIDFWVICDESKAHLFFTSLDGRMWRCETKLLDFPKGWTQPSVVLHVDIFEASHTYRLKGLNKFVTLVEAQDGGRRYYKAYLAERLEGEWKPLAATKDKPFASLLNVRDNGSHWTDSISHGELIRSGYDERLEVDPANLRFLFQGVTEEARSGKKYGEIPWTLGILERRLPCDEERPPARRRTEEVGKNKRQCLVRSVEHSSLPPGNEQNTLVPSSVLASCRSSCFPTGAQCCSRVQTFNPIGAHC